MAPVADAEACVTPPFLSVVHGDEGVQLVLTVEADELNVCDKCPHLHVRLLYEDATPDNIRLLAAGRLGLADRLEQRGVR